MALKTKVFLKEQFKDMKDSVKDMKDQVKEQMKEQIKKHKTKNENEETPVVEDNKSKKLLSRMRNSFQVNELSQMNK